MADSDYEETTLSADTLAALQEFLHEQAEQESIICDDQQLPVDGKDFSVAENWVFHMLYSMSTQGRALFSLDIRPQTAMIHTDDKS